MNRLNLLILILLSFLGSSAFTHISTDCPAIEASYTVIKPDFGQKNGTITISAKGGSGKLHYFFFNEAGRPINSKKEQENFIKNLAQGTYRCSVIDESGCIKQLLIELNSK